MRRLALGAPYSAQTTLQGKAHLEAHGLEVVNFANLQGVTNIYDETAERAYGLARLVDRQMPKPSSSAAPACRHCRYWNCWSRIWGSLSFPAPPR